MKTTEALRGEGYHSLACTVSLLLWFSDVSQLGYLASYDYGSSLTESRLLTSKFDELKRQGIFLRSSPDFYKTDWVGNSSSSAVNVSNPDAFVVLLSNPDTGSKFYIARQADSTST